MLGAELRKPDGSPDPEGTDFVLAFQPPLVISESDVSFMLDVLESSLQTALR